MEAENDKNRETRENLHSAFSITIIALSITIIIFFNVLFSICN